MNAGASASASIQQHQGDSPSGREDSLPEGWASSSLRDLVELKYGKGLVQDGRRPGDVPVYGSNGVVGQHDEAVTLGPTIILGRKGSVGEVHFSATRCWPIDTTYFVDDFGPFDCLYLTHSLRALRLGELDQSTAIPGLSREQVYSTGMPVPPLAEQKRIVAKVEALLTRVNAARARLANVPALLKRFRQSVLAAACSGQLTADWREVNSSDQSATQLLASIAEQRRISWRAAVRKAELNGERKPRMTLPNDVPVVRSSEADLPETWAITNVDFLAHVTKLAGFEYTKHIKLQDEGDVPVVRAQNVQMGRFVPENLKYISCRVSDSLARSQLHGRELLMVFIGAGTGNVCMAPPEGRWHLAPNVAKVDVDGVDARYVLLYLQSPVGFSYMNSWIKATAQPSLSMETIRKICVHLPPLAEQHEIVRRVEALFALADKVEARVEAATARVEKITQAILAKTFRGELVPTEAELARQEGRAYEPASALLERIRAARATDVNNTKQRPRRRRAGPADESR